MATAYFEWLSSFWLWLTTNRYTRFLEEENRNLKDELLRKEQEFQKRETWLLEQIVRKAGGVGINPLPQQSAPAQVPFKPPRQRAIEELQLKVSSEQAERRKMERAAQGYKERL